MTTFDKSTRLVYDTHIRYRCEDLGLNAFTRVVYDGGIHSINVDISSKYLNMFRDGGYRWCTMWNKSEKFVFPDGTIEK